MRVMGGVSRFLEKRLKLKVNGEKSAVAPASGRDLLSFRIIGGRKPKRGISQKARKRFRKRVKEITRRTRGVPKTPSPPGRYSRDHPPHARGAPGAGGSRAQYLPARMDRLLRLLPDPVRTP